MIYSDKFCAFMAEIQQRLERGEREYKDKSFFLPAQRLLAEVREEVRDVCAWSFILDTKLAEIADKLRRVGVV